MSKEYKKVLVEINDALEFNFDHDKRYFATRMGFPAASVRLYLVEGRMYADLITLSSKIDIKGLYPCVAYNSSEMKVYSIALDPNGNEDDRIPPIG